MAVFGMGVADRSCASAC